jgi:hypothetical protein
MIFGTSLEVPDLFEHGDVYGEFNYSKQDFELPGIPRSSGYAAYVGTNLYLGDFTVTAEFKAYSDFDLHTTTDNLDPDDEEKYLAQRLDYIRPPTLEPEDMEVHNNENITGGRLKVDWRPGGGDTLVFASYAGFTAEDLGDVGDRYIYNAQLGAEQDFLRRGRVGLDVGLREETPEYAGGEHHHLLYINLNLKLPILTRHSVDLHATHWMRHDYAKPPMATDPRVKDFWKGSLTLDYSWSPYLSVGFIMGYDTEKSGERNFKIFFEPAEDIKIRQVFLAGNLVVNLSSRVVFKLLVGQLRGGLLCVSGACREFPSFSGVRFTTVLRF